MEVRGMSKDFWKNQAEIWHRRFKMRENEVRVLLEILKINEISLEPYRYLFPENQVPTKGEKE